MKELSNEQIRRPQLIFFRESASLTITIRNVRVLLSAHFIYLFLSFEPKRLEANRNAPYKFSGW
jgi:hypothetical protein